MSHRTQAEAWTDFCACAPRTESISFDFFLLLKILTVCSVQRYVELSFVLACFSLALFWCLVHVCSRWIDSFHEQCSLNMNGIQHNGLNRFHLIFCTLSYRIGCKCQAYKDLYMHQLLYDCHDGSITSILHTIFKNICYKNTFEPHRYTLSEMNKKKPYRINSNST